ncbi:MAG: hypothetical protein IPJ85_10330 [Flavobacteriales bacterium]|nr:hypothetical protein [Flavobacteriales bacterium]
MWRASSSSCATAASLNRFGTWPYSEAIGFITDLRAIRPASIWFTTCQAHEVARTNGGAIMLGPR